MPWAATKAGREPTKPRVRRAERVEPVLRAESQPVLRGRPMEGRRLEQQLEQQLEPRAGPMWEERVEQPEQQAAGHTEAVRQVVHIAAGPEAGRTAGPGRLAVGRTAELLAGLHRQLPCSP